jgi:predicted AAA+ superfamily ATPase
MEILRLKEIELLKTLKDKKIIKILIGTRRVGKSILLAQFQNKIINEYLIDSSCIQVYDFNDKRFVKQYD